MKYIKLIFINCIIFIVLIVISEFALQAIGRKPYDIQQKASIAEVSERRFFQADTLLGYKHCKGQFNLQLHNGNYQFSTTHLESTLRKSAPNAENNILSKDEIWLMGCSFIYGWSLNDEETYAWKLQRKLPQYQIRNYGVNGYGTLHFYLQLKKALEKNRPPKLVIIHHADFHHERNINTYNYHKAITQWNDFGQIKRPYLNTSSYKALQINYLQNNYTPWEISKKYVLADRFQICWERFIDGRYHKSSLKITAFLLDQIHTLCKKNDIDLLIANVGLKKEFIYSYIKEKSIPFVDIAVDYTIPKYNNLPYDKHPNTVANDSYSNEIYQYMIEYYLNR